MPKITIDREVLHQLARRASGDYDHRKPESLGESMDLRISDAARRIADATAEQVGGTVEIAA